MKVAITQRQTTINNITYDCLEQGWYKLFCNHTIIPVPNIDAIPIKSDLLVLSGGNLTPARLKTELTHYRYALANNIPIIGVCHGAFLINQLHQGINASINNHHSVSHHIDMENRTYKVNSYHKTSIKHLGVCLDAIGWHTNSIEAFRHKFLPIWGIVWHPERMEIPVLPSDLWNLIYGN